MHKLRNLLGPLQVFDAVHRAGGISRAAELLHITPGAVSQQIKLLEATMGIAALQSAAHAWREGDRLDLRTASDALAVSARLAAPSRP